MAKKQESVRYLEPDDRPIFRIGDKKYSPRQVRQMALAERIFGMIATPILVGMAIWFGTSGGDFNYAEGDNNITTFFE